MRKIYWFLQQLEFLGGTETATISIANELVNNYEITFVVTAREIKNIPYNINKKIKIIFLNNEDNSKIDEKILEFCKEKRFFNAFLLILKNINFIVFAKYKYRRILKKMTSKDDILIGSSLDNYLIIPRSRLFIFHYHFNAKFFNSFNEKFMSLFYRKPDYYVFLSKTILEAISKHKKRIIKKAFYIHNPIKINGYFNDKINGHNLIFIGRFADQKNPILLIEVMNELIKINKEFRLEMYGDGKLKDEIIARISTLHLENNIKIYKPSNDIEGILNNKDLLILTSIYEGMPLVINEAASCSVPVLSTNFGESVQDSITNKNGIVVDSFNPLIIANTINELFLNQEKLINLKRSAYEFSQKFNKKSIKNEWLSVLNKIKK